jgi:hypothetical protein
MAATVRLTVTVTMITTGKNSKSYSVTLQQAAGAAAAAAAASPHPASFEGVHFKHKLGKRGARIREGVADERQAAAPERGRCDLVQWAAGN